MVAAIVVAAVLAVALITAGIVFLTGDDGGTGKDAKGTPGGPGSSQPSTPSEEPESPSEEPDDGEATDFPTPGEESDYPSSEPSEDVSDRPLPSFMLKVGDCYNRSDEGEGTVEARDCGSPHDAEVVSSKKITGDYSSDAEVRRKADSLCRVPLRDKARQQPRGTVGGTLISFPKARGVSAGINNVTCSLTAGEGKKLNKPLA